jgi:apolipoprotein N-acyltransferase
MNPSCHPPRKVTVATVIARLAGDAAARTAMIDRLVAEAQATGRLDLVVLPEAALQAGGRTAAEQALAIDDPAVQAVAAMARRAGAYVVLPMILREGAACANAAVLLDRGGAVAGIYRKVHPVAGADGVFEGGITPGRTYPVFTCDFGRLGIQICWDMSYEEGWRALAEAGAELVALPTMSPQTVRPAAYAQRFRYWVVNATPRDNATVWNPIGLPDAHIESPGVLVHRFDLSAAVVHWSTAIEEGRAFARAFTGRGGFSWSAREDTGLFWSDDPATPVAAMLRQLGVEEMDATIARIGKYLDPLRTKL